MLPPQLRQRFNRMFHWHLVHKGETVCHVMYLVFTTIESHGMHTIFAGGVVLFMTIGSAMARSEAKHAASDVATGD